MYIYIYIASLLKERNNYVFPVAVNYVYIQMVNQYIYIYVSYIVSRIVWNVYNQGSSFPWEKKLGAPGDTGRNGMSSSRAASFFIVACRKALSASIIVWSVFWRDGQLDGLKIGQSSCIGIVVSLFNLFMPWGTIYIIENMWLMYVWWTANFCIAPHAFAGGTCCNASSRSWPMRVQLLGQW